jgi:pyruvate formate lyase activating enzyme
MAHRERVTRVSIERLQMDWRKGSRVASYWHFKPEHNKVECSLCPRHCSLRDGQMGFCLVRGNKGNQLHTYNYGRSVQATIECIETEAINHYRPGARILSMGNVGCMMSCTFCQNWQTSQVKHLDNRNVKIYTPEEVIALAEANGIGVISWTYNDPVVWQEFVVDTSRLARSRGIKTLYKSALYIEAAPLDELIGLIDIFSISLKSMDPDMYWKHTGGRLEPVLRGIRQIYASGRHLEISQLVVTGLNDNGDDAKKTARWMVEHLDPDVPLHLVAYHPAFRYREPRTPVDTLLRLRDLALAEGIRYCYIGNVYADGVSNSLCRTCEAKLVQRFGLRGRVVGLDAAGRCTNCGTQSPIREFLPVEKVEAAGPAFVASEDLTYEWTGEVNSIHVVFAPLDRQNVVLWVQRTPSGASEYIRINQGIERVILSRSEPAETAVTISIDHPVSATVLPVLDRAHFPTPPESRRSPQYLN